MGCCNDPSVTLASSVQNPALHVNYAKGMVLGVDDFMQEHAYLSGRDNWTVAELVGYGTTSGLAVTVADTKDGPQIRVARGAAAVPSGKLVCVPVDQCGGINAWLAKPENATKVNTLTNASPPLSPPAATTPLSLYLTLCYSDCATMPVPIPGEPCRSEDELMAPSRIADDYKLELRTEAPPQTEEDAVRDVVAWLRQVPIVDASPPLAGDETAWIAALRAAAKPWFDAEQASPPSSPPASFATLGDYLFGSPPLGLSIGRQDLCKFLRAAFRFWVTELRPFWMTRMCGSARAAEDDCVLLARLEVPIVWVGGSPTGAWQVDGSAAAVVVDESRRPYLAHMRLLEEWLLCGCDCGGAGDAPTSAGPIAYLETNKDITLDTTHHVVVGTGPASQKITLPSANVSKGRIYVVKSINPTTLVCSGGDTVDGPTLATSGPAVAIKAKNAFTVVSNGDKTWHVIATVA
ncbi:MAG: hypothetical protein WA418_07125 [Bradyrhizobium sp.]